MSERQRILTELCGDCTALLTKLEPLERVFLLHLDCQKRLTQGLRIIASHPEFDLGIKRQ